MYTVLRVLLQLRIKKSATIFVHIQQVLSNLWFNRGIHSRDDKFLTFSAMVNLHPKEETSWLCFVDETFFDSPGCASPENILNEIWSKDGKWNCSEYQVQ